MFLASGLRNKRKKQFSPGKSGALWRMFVLIPGDNGDQKAGNPPKGTCIEPVILLLCLHVTCVRIRYAWHHLYTRLPFYGTILPPRSTSPLHHVHNKNSPYQRDNMTSWNTSDNLTQVLTYMQERAAANTVNKWCRKTCACDRRPNRDSKSMHLPYLLPRQVCTSSWMYWSLASRNSCLNASVYQERPYRRRTLLAATGTPRWFSVARIVERTVAGKSSAGNTKTKIIQIMNKEIETCLI